MKKIEVGNRKVIFSSTLLIPEKEEVVISCDVDEKDTLTARITFEYDPIGETSKDNVNNAPIKPDATLDVNFDDDVFHLKFNNFSSTKGLSFAKPLVFAESDDGRDISLMAFVIKRSKMMQVELQIMVGA